MTLLVPETAPAPLRRPVIVFAVVLAVALPGLFAGPPWAWGAVAALSLAATALWRAVNRYAQLRRLRLPLPCTVGADDLVVELPDRLRGPVTLVLRCVREENGSGAVARTVLYDEEAEVPEPTAVRFRVPPRWPGRWELDVRARGFAARYPVSHQRATDQPTPAPTA